MQERGTIFIASDFRHDDDWLGQVGVELRSRGFEVIHGPRQQEGEITQFPRADWERLFARTNIIVTSSRSVISREILAYASTLRAVVFPTIGTETVDLPAATELGIVVAHGPTPENFSSMAESTVLLMLALLYDLHGTELVLREGRPAPKLLRARMMMGRTVGLIGLGRIARGIVQRLAAWDVRILSTTRHTHSETPVTGVHFVSLEELLRQSDIVSMHATLTPESRLMMGAAQFALMKPSAFFVNTARGGLVDQKALCEALRSNGIAGAALDTFEDEPLPAASPLRGLDNAILTPHMIGHTREAVASIPTTLIENIERISRGEPPLYWRNPQGEPASC